MSASRIITGLLVGVLLWPAVAGAQYEYIDINKPSFQKIPIAIPYFKGEGPAAVGMAQKASDITAETLDFTGYFEILDRGAFLVDPQKSDVTLATINFQNWTAIGAELLITGKLTMQGELLELELRLFDTVQAQRLIGKRYKGWEKDLRKMIRRFCGEVIYFLTGTHGIFNSQIAFVSTGSGNKEIYTCDFDGSNAKPFTKNGSINLFPDWSSDGKWLAYTSYADGRPEIFIKGVQESRGQKIKKKGLNITPAWMPGRFMLAATLSFSGDQDIYLLSGNGKVEKRLTRETGIDTSPTWAPGGGKFAFVSNRSGTPQIYMKSVSGGNAQRLTFQGNYNTQPSWSPKGDKIAYSAMAKGGAIDICVIDLNSRRISHLTRNSGKNESPTWSPDGGLIAFSSNREGNWRIYVMTAFGTDQRRLLALPGNQTDPSWSSSMTND